MTEAAAAARRAYKRQWAKDHPENVRATQARYWEKKAAAMQEAAAQEARETAAGQETAAQV